MSEDLDLLWSNGSSSSVSSRFPYLVLSEPSPACSLLCRSCSPSSPPQFGHLFAKGETREAAIRAMVVALKEIKIR